MLDVKLLANKATVKKFNKGEIIYRENEKKCDDIFILLIGKVNVYKNYELSTEIVLDTVIPGNVFGETNLSNVEYNIDTAKAEDNTTVAVITKRNLISLVKQNSTLLLQIIDLLCERVKKTQNMIDYNNYEKIEIVNKYRIDLKEFYKSVLFPDGHKKYSLIQPDCYDDYIIKEQYTCPCCKEKFEDYSILSSKLSLMEEMKCDMRKKYNNFEPIWYEIKTCPYCNFSAFESLFTSGLKVNEDEFINKLNLARHGINIVDNENEKRNVNQVFNSHYLALICSSGFENYKQINAKLWLSLSWLYKDINDNKMEAYATERAYEANKVFYNECNLSDELSQTTLMIIGTLAKRLGNYDEAILNLSKAIRTPNCKSVYKRLIDMEVDNIRSMKKK